MAFTKFFLDTNSLKALAGLEGEELEHFKSQQETNKIELCISHVQIDEKYTREFPNYQKKIDMALRKIKGKGIKISPLEPTIGLVVGVSRVGYARICGEEVAKIDSDLRREIKKCMGKKAEKMNIARDALIALSSLDCDFFITSDRCLYESWLKIVEENPENRKLLEQKHRIPEAIYIEPIPQKVSQEIVNRVS